MTQTRRSFAGFSHVSAVATATSGWHPQPTVAPWTEKHDTSITGKARGEVCGAAPYGGGQSVVATELAQPLRFD
jgi:hypothetical protein